MVEMKIAYQGDLLCEATHGPSAVVLKTDAPVDNMGQGRSFSPTDLLATSVGTCMLTVMGIVAQRHNIDLKGTQLVVRKEMVSQPVRRVGRLEIEICAPAHVSAEDRKRLENAADVCPAKRSLHPDIEVQIRFRWGA